MIWSRCNLMGWEQLEVTRKGLYVAGKELEVWWVELKVAAAKIVVWLSIKFQSFNWVFLVLACGMFSLQWLTRCTKTICTGRWHRDWQWQIYIHWCFGINIEDCDNMWTRWLLTVDSIPADDRTSFYNLQSTWQKTPPLYNNQVFSNKALQELDDMAKTHLDHAWPFFGAEGQQ